METPKNCTECEHATGCRSYYGGNFYFDSDLEYTAVIVAA